MNASLGGTNTNKEFGWRCEVKRSPPQTQYTVPKPPQGDLQCFTKNLNYMHWIGSLFHGFNYVSMITFRALLKMIACSCVPISHPNHVHCNPTPLKHRQKKLETRLYLICESPVLRISQFIQAGVNGVLDHWWRATH